MKLLLEMLLLFSGVQAPSGSPQIFGGVDSLAMHRVGGWYGAGRVVHMVEDSARALLFVGLNQRIMVLDETVPDSLPTVHQMDIPEGVQRLVYDPDSQRLVVVSRVLQVLDVRVPDQPQVVWDTVLPFVPYDAVLNGDLLYLAAGTTGVAILQVLP